MYNSKKNKKVDNAAYLMIAPAYILFFFFVLIPIVEVFYYSLTNYNMVNQPNWVGIDNYLRMFQDKALKKSLLNTLKYALGSLVPQLFIAVVVANLLFCKSRFVPFFRIAFFLPHVMSMVCASMIWLWMYDPNSGTFNIIINFLGFQKQTFISDPKQALICLIIMSIWKSCGYSMVIYLSGLTAVPAELYEAGMLDGAGPFTKFIYITWPQLRPTTVFLLITGIIGCFSVFEQVNIMTSGGPLNSTTTIVHQIFNRGFANNQMGYACAISSVLFVVVSILTLLIIKFGFQGDKDYEI